MMNGGVIDYNCNKFTDTALSSTEAEWYAACEAAKSGKWLRNMLSEMGLPLTSPLVIFEDNQGCISYGTPRINQWTMKHIDLKYHFLKGEISRGIIEMRRVPSAENLADIFTKALAKIKFRELRERLNINPVPKTFNIIAFFCGFSGIRQGRI